MDEAGQMWQPGPPRWAAATGEPVNADLTTARVGIGLPFARAAAATARTATRETLTTWGVAEETTWAAELIADELVANAVLHTDAPRWAGAGLTLLLMLARGQDPQRLLIEVYDLDGQQLPHPVDAGPCDVTGRGLRLITELSCACGTWLTGAGKAVWAELLT
jgi:hypothetical protein